MASISQNQYDYLNSLVSAGGGNGEWAKAQLSGATVYAPPAAATSTPTPSVTQSSPPTYQQASQGSSSSSSAPVYAPTYNPANAATSNSYPTTGYGGANYNNADYDTRTGISANENRLATDPNFIRSEIERANSVIAARGTGMDNSEQMSYLERLKGMIPQDVPLKTFATSSPVTYAPQDTSNRAFNVGTNADRQSEADRKYALALEEKRRITEQQKTGLNTTYGRLRQNINEDRALQDSSFQRNSNPFSGKTSYDKGISNLQRERSDREMAQDLATRSANIDEMLATYENASLEERQRMVDELTRADRTFGLEQGSLTGNYNGSRTLAAQNQDYNQARQTKIDNWNAYMDSVGLTGNLGTGAKADWSLLGSTSGAPTLAAKSTLLQQEGLKINNEIAALELANLPTEQKLKIQQLQKQIAEIGRAPYQSAVDAEYDKIKLDTAREQLKQLKTGVTPKELADQAKKMESEKTGLTNALKSGDISYTDAQKSIKEDLTLGFYTQAQATELLQLLETWASNSYGNRWNE